MVRPDCWWRKGILAGMTVAIERMLQDPAWYAQLGAAGRRHVEQGFTLEKHLTDLSRFLIQIHAMEGIGRTGETSAVNLRALFEAYVWPMLVNKKIKPLAGLYITSRGHSGSTLLSLLVSGVSQVVSAGELKMPKHYPSLNVLLCSRLPSSGAIDVSLLGGCRTARERTCWLFS